MGEEMNLEHVTVFHIEGRIYVIVPAELPFGQGYGKELWSALDGEKLAIVGDSVVGIGDVPEEVVVDAFWETLTDIELDHLKHSQHRGTINATINSYLG